VGERCRNWARIDANNNCISEDLIEQPSTPRSRDQAGEKETAQRETGPSQ